MSRNTNDGLTRSGTRCFIAVPIWQQLKAPGKGLKTWLYLIERKRNMEGQAALQLHRAQTTRQRISFHFAHHSTLDDNFLSTPHHTGQTLRPPVGGVRCASLRWCDETGFTCLESAESTLHRESRRARRACHCSSSK